MESKPELESYISFVPKRKENSPRRKFLDINICMHAHIFVFTHRHIYLHKKKLIPNVHFFSSVVDTIQQDTLS